MTTYKQMLPSKVEYLIVHCAATPPSMDIGAAEIKQWHLQRDFFDIGYHYVIRRNGRIEKGRPDDQPGAHARGYNGKSIGICLVGGVAEADKKTPEFNFTELQTVSLRVLLKELKAKFPKAEIIGHRDVEPHKACPSFDVRGYLKDNPLL